MHRWAGQFFHTAQDKKLCGCIELIVESRRVRAVWPGNVNDYSLSCACKQNSVAVYPILVFLRVFVCLPNLSVETTTALLRSAPQEIGRASCRERVSIWVVARALKQQR